LEARLVKRLWILRHAKSSWDNPGLADRDRPLAPRGKKAGRRIARWAETNDVRPDLVICSSAVRATATLELVLPGLGDPVARIDPRLYHAYADDALDLVASEDDAVEGILLIGHNPTLHELIATLAPPGPDVFPTGALAGLRLAIDTWRDLGPACGRIETFVVPRSLPS
jgi:phosphohistidine phosphatase